VLPDRPAVKLVVTAPAPALAEAARVEVVVSRAAREQAAPAEPGAAARLDHARQADGSPAIKTN